MKTELSSDMITDGDDAVLDIGHELTTTRTKLNLSQRDIATKLKIPLEQVKALEENRFDFFRSKTFARGYLKGYVRLLQLDEALLLSRFDHFSAEKSPILQPVNKVNKQAHLTDPIVLFVSIVLVAVLVFLAFWWPNMEKQNAENAVLSAMESSVDAQNDDAELVSNVDDLSVENDTLSNVVIEDEDIVTGLSAETIAILEEAGVKASSIQPLVKVNSGAVSPVVESNNQALETPIEKPIETPITNTVDDLMIRFAADCWVEVRDGTGRILYSGIKKAGTELAQTGTAPYRVVLGYAPGVTQVKFKGEVFDFTPFIRKDLARFELK
jgi:cytoskeleton protein RodZ